MRALPNTVLADVALTGAVTVHVHTLIIIIIINFIYNALYIQESQSASEKKKTLALEIIHND